MSSGTKKIRALALRAIEIASLAKGATLVGVPITEEESMYRSVYARRSHQSRSRSR
jgi:hypothetical protein